MYFWNYFIRAVIFLSFLVFLSWLYITVDLFAINELPEEKINLALRKTADNLLRLSGDSTSRIPAIEKTEGSTWQLQLNQSFSYERLPELLHEAFEMHQIRQPYDVKVRRCSDGMIDLGYNYLEFSDNAKVACQGRDMPEGCHFIELSFLKTAKTTPVWFLMSLIVVLVLWGIAAWWYFLKNKNKTELPLDKDMVWLKFGNSKLDTSNQLLVCGENQYSLTYRETKLLQLFAANFGKLLEREFILQMVWADEGVLVGRSIDVFVSRLRKKLAGDPSLAIIVVHGLGYRLESAK